MLRKEWALDSAKAGKLLRASSIHLYPSSFSRDLILMLCCLIRTAESKYVLKDGENKYKVDLQGALGRARKGKLMAGKTIYVAGKSVAASVALLKTVVAASGGQVRLSNLLQSSTPSSVSPIFDLRTVVGI